MDEIKMNCEVKRWGNSLGVILPKHIVNELDLKPKDNIDINVKKRITVADLFGISPRDNKMIGDTQRFKNELRKEWSKW